MTKAKLLTAYLAERQPAPFSWPGSNCGHFGGAWVQIVEGFDPLAGLAATPTKAAAARLLRRMGGYQSLVSRQLDREPVAPAFARLGDLVLTAIDGGEEDALALGVCCGNGSAAFVTDQGSIAFLAVSRARCAWRVGA